MGIGIPKVPYYDPDTDLQWIDLFDRLYCEKTIFLFQEINSTVANRIIFTILMMDSEIPILFKRKEEIFLFINSPGGGTLDGLSIYDAMRQVRKRIDIKTIGIGFVASTAAFLLASGSVPKRIAFPHTRIMLSRPRTKFPGDLTATEVLEEMQEVQRLYYTTARFLAQRSGQYLSTIVRDMEKGTFFSAREARDYGLLDHVIPERSRERKKNIYREYIESLKKKKK